MLDKIIWKIFHYKAGFYASNPALYEKIFKWRDDIFAEMRLAFILSGGNVKEAGRTFDKFLKYIGYHKKVKKWDFQLKNINDDGWEEEFVSLVILTYKQHGWEGVKELLKIYNVDPKNKKKLNKILNKYF